ncbi:uncharacterized protein [Enoplosus armatus]|uniref:uncharacterized protein n=1 Tax=Enoplosus armatus TaxID=215367 RepID=UPI0039953F0E
MDTECLLIFVFVLRFEAGISKEPTLYDIPGNEVILPCSRAASSDRTCSMISWLYNRDTSKTITLLMKGNVKQEPEQAARLSLNTNCSLVIKDITAEDVGRYTCRQMSSRDTLTRLSVLTISPLPPAADPKGDGDVTLQCSLLRYDPPRICQKNSIRWVDETESVLALGEGAEFKCVSVLTVKRQSGHNRRYTCQFLDKSNVEIEAHYTPDFTDASPDHTYVIVGAVVGGVLVLVIIAAVLTKCRKRAKVNEDVQKPTQHPDEPESNVTYVTISHANPWTAAKKGVREEAVTYSTVKTPVKTDADNDPSSLYSYIISPK